MERLPLVAIGLSAFLLTAGALYAYPSDEAPTLSASASFDAGGYLYIAYDLEPVRHVPPPEEEGSLRTIHFEHPVRLKTEHRFAFPDEDTKRTGNTLTVPAERRHLLLAAFDPVPVRITSTHHSEGPFHNVIVHEGAVVLHRLGPGGDDGLRRTTVQIEGPFYAQVLQDQGASPLSFRAFGPDGVVHPFHVANAWNWHDASGIGHRMPGFYGEPGIWTFEAEMDSGSLSVGVLLDPPFAAEAPDFMFNTVGGQYALFPRYSEPGPFHAWDHHIIVGSPKAALPSSAPGDPFEPAPAQIVSRSERA